MSEAWEQIKQRYECSHDRRELRKKATRAGAEWFWNQCVECGEAVRVAAPPPSQRAAVPERDENIRRGHFAAQMEEFAQVRHQEDAKWWDWYRAYLRSEGWRWRRARVLSRAKGRCEGCGVADATEVHHLTYARVGQEMLFDLVAICHPCHEAVTEGDRKRRASWGLP